MITVGQVAGIVAIGCDPLQDLRCLADVRRVMRDSAILLYTAGANPHPPMRFARGNGRQADAAERSPVASTSDHALRIQKRPLLVASLNSPPS